MPHTPFSSSKGIPLRTLAALLAAIVLLGAAGCSFGKTGPSIAVSAYLDTVKAMDIAAGNAYLVSPTVEGDLFLSGRASALPSEDETYLKLFNDAVAKIWGDMTYKVKGTSITGDTAVVAVEITIADMTSLEGMMTSAAFDGMSSTPEAQDKMITEVLVEELQTAAASTAAQRITHTVRLDMQRLDGAWKITDHKTLGRTLIGNISGLLIPSA